MDCHGIHLQLVRILPLLIPPKDSFASSVKPRFACLRRPPCGLYFLRNVFVVDVWIVVVLCLPDNEKNGVQHLAVSHAALFVPEKAGLPAGKNFTESVDGELMASITKRCGFKKKFIVPSGELSTMRVGHTLP